jgi:hypothetical protein
MDRGSFEDRINLAYEMLYFSTLIWLFYCPLYLVAIPLLALRKKQKAHGMKNYVHLSP